MIFNFMSTEYSINDHSHLISLYLDMLVKKYYCKSGKKINTDISANIANVMYLDYFACSFYVLNVKNPFSNHGTT
jgi:uncharacterized membrane protein